MFGRIFKQLKMAFIPCHGNKYRPRFLGSKFLLYYALALLFLKIAVVPFLLYFPETVFFADLTKINLMELTNSARQSFGLQSLQENQTLNEAAYLKAKDMIEKSYFAHYSPKGIAPWHWLDEIGYNYLSAGENLAIGFLESEQVHQAWMNSSLHKENILNPNYREIGIAVLKGSWQGNETTFVVQFFGTPKKLVLAGETEPVQVATEEEKPAAVDSPAAEIPAEGETEELAAISGHGQVISAATGEKLEEPLLFLFFQFITSGYYDLIQKIVYGSLFFIILSLLLTVFYDLFIYRKFEIQYKDIVFKTVGYVALWFVLVFLDKLVIIQLLAHNFRIN